jgi:ABC-type Na+ transport system ATPase subunit NatA
MDEAERICDRVAILHEGRLRAIGTIPELQASTGASSLAEVFRATVRASEAT